MSADNVLKANLEEAAGVLRERLGNRKPAVGIVLGSGLGPLAEQIENAVIVPFGEIPHMKRSTATGHKGRFVCGELGGKTVLAMQGRLHGYEGNSPAGGRVPHLAYASSGRARAHHDKRGRRHQRVLCPR